MDTTVPAENPSPSAESESSDSDASSSSSEEEEYQTVGGKRKKSAPAKAAQATKAKKTTDDSVTPAPPTPRQSVPSTSSARPQAADLPKRQRIPPVIIRDKGKWTEVSKMCVDRRIQYTNAKSVTQGVQVTLRSSNDYRALTKALKDRKVCFHTYALPEETPTRVVIRRVPKEIPTNEIKEDLLSQNVPVTAVHRLRRARGGDEYDMVLVVCEPTEEHNPIFKIKSVCSLSGISIEKPNKPSVLGQCHRCQMYGHAQSNCFATPRCVKCLGEHGTADCPRPKDPKECTEPPSCVLCGQTGHPANYRGCPKAPKMAPKVIKRANARQLRESPSVRAPAPAALIPERLAPQRASPWSKLNHQRAFPALVPPRPAPVPAPVAKATPVAAPTSAPVAPVGPPTGARRIAAPAAMPATHSPAGDSDKSVGLTILEAYQMFRTPEARALAAIIKQTKKAGQYTPEAAHEIWARFDSIAKVLDQLD